MDATRWDPLTGTASAAVSSTVDMSEALLGMFTKPVEEYKHEQRRREREREKEESRRASDVQGQFEDYSQISPETSTTSDSVSVHSGKEKQKSMTAILASASAKSFGMVVPRAAKSMADVPLAFAEGMRVTPGRLGMKVRDHGPVTDAKSGVTVAAKTLGWGLVDGFGDLVMEPVRGGMRDGAGGAAMGVGKGLVSAVTKTGAGFVGVIGYTGAGITKSIRSAVYSGTAKLIAKSRHLEGQWLRERGLPDGKRGDVLVDDFFRLKSRKDGE